MAPDACGQLWDIDPAHDRRRTVLDDLPTPTDQTVMPAACPTRWSTEGYHGHCRTTPYVPRPGLTHVGHAAEETWHGRGQIRGWPAECTCPPLQPQARLCPQGNLHRCKDTGQRTREVPPLRLALEPLRTLRSETKGQAGACPDRTRAIPCKVRVITAEVSMIRNMHGMISAARTRAAES